MPTGAMPDPPAHTARIVLVHTLGGLSWSNGFWMKSDGSDTPALNDFTDFLYEFATEWGEQVQPHLSVDDTLVTVQGVYFGSGSDAINGEREASFPGEVEADAIAIHTCACISWPIAAHYRGGHPRTYVSGLTAAAIGTVSQLDAGFRNTLAGAAASFRSAVNALTLDGAGMTLGVVSFVDNNAWRSPPTFRSYPGSPSVDARIDTQRRRLGRDL